jgi:hypothetical protein
MIGREGGGKEYFRKRHRSFSILRRAVSSQRQDSIVSEPPIVIEASPQFRIDKCAEKKLLVLVCSGLGPPEQQRGEGLDGHGGGRGAGRRGGRTGSPSPPARWPHTPTVRRLERTQPIFLMLGSYSRARVQRVQKET